MNRVEFLNLALENKPFENELQKAAKRVIDSGRFIGGEEVHLLENDLCEKFYAKHAVGVASGLDALTIGLRAAIITGHLKEGDKVMVPANTYIASFLAITNAGLIPVPVDPDETTYNLTGDIVELNMSSGIKAIMPVHLYGRAAWDEKMARLAKEHNLLVIEDAAQSIGARAKSKGLFNSYYTGALGHIGALSFYPTKNIGALGDAGAIITSITEIAEAAKALGNYGSKKRYDNLYIGYNSRLDPLQAAFIRVKLKHIDQLNADRFANVVAYNNTINNPLIIKPILDPVLTDNVWHQYVIRCEERDRLRKFLADNGVETDIHYPTPPHKQPCYRNQFANHHLPVTEKLANEVISLPVAPATINVKTSSDVGRLINQFK